MSFKIKITECTSIETFHDCRRIFDATWSRVNGTEITQNLLQALVHAGSYLSAAFVENKMVGCALAFPANSGCLYLHSHMTAVLDEYRDKGIGYALKIDQWSWAKKKNYPYLSWTFDPLVRRNAKLNIVKLGVDISAYHPNFYGEMPDVLNAGDESDRLMVSWRTDIDAPKARELIKHPKPDDVLIEIPDDIITIRSKDKSEGIKWRRRVRDQFMAAFEKSGKVVGFSVNNEYVVRM
jgi:predicted GNAT superfamily acetyltransferase